MGPWDDRRGQSMQIGAILLFGFLVLSLSSYQAFVVPQQNEKIEFRHSQTVANDMQVLRDDLLETAYTGKKRAAEVKLGTQYPPRTFAINPGPASGTLRTTTVGSGEISLDAPGADIESICGLSTDGDDAVPSRSIVYRPDYNVYDDAPTIVYENTVVYRRFDDAVILDSGQTIVQGDQINIPPLVGAYSESGTRTVSMDLIGGKIGVGNTLTTSQTVLTIPSALSVDKWEELLSDQMTPGGHVVGVAQGPDPNEIEITLEAAEYHVTCPVVGAGVVPNNEPENTQGSSDGINPAGNNAIRLVSIAQDPNNKDLIVVTFRNPGGETTLSTARFNFYYDQDGDGPAQLDVQNTSTGNTLVEDLELRGVEKQPTSTVTFGGQGATTKLTLRFEDSLGNVFTQKKDDFAVVNLQFADGDGANYFIDMPQGQSTGGGTGGSSGSATELRYVSGSVGGTSNSLSFDMENPSDGGSQVTITGFKVEDIGSTNSYSKFSILDGGQNSVATGSFQADNSSYQFTDYGGSDARIDEGSTGTVSISGLNGQNLQDANNRNSATISVTLIAFDGSEVTVFFK